MASRFQWHETYVQFYGTCPQKLLRYHDRYLATACVIRCYSTQTIRAFLKPTNYRKFQVKRSNGDSHILWPAWSAAMVRTGTTIFALVLSAVHRSIADSGQIIFFQVHFWVVPLQFIVPKWFFCILICAGACLLPTAASNNNACRGWSSPLLASPETQLFKLYMSLSAYMRFPLYH